MYPAGAIRTTMIQNPGLTNEDARQPPCAMKIRNISGVPLPGPIQDPRTSQPASLLD